MRRSLLLLTVLAASLFKADAQQITSTELGYQEFTTSIASSIVDSDGSTYYIGSFKGELKINGQLLAVGAGNTDIYVIKMNRSGTVLWHKTFGNQQDQNGRAVYFLNGSLYISYSSMDSLQMGPTVLAPYSAGTSISGLSKMNASNGDLIWSRRTNTLLSFVGFGSDIRLWGGGASFVRWDNQVLLDSVGGFRQVLLHLDTASGNIRSTQRLTTTTGTLTLQAVEQLSPSRIFLCLRTNATSSISFNGQPQSLSSSSGQLLFIKTDTNFTNTSFRQMNPGTSLPIQLGFTRTNLIFSPTKDSIYLIANSNSSADNIFYALDGYNLSLFRKNALIVLDTQFVTRRAHLIGNHPTAQNSLQFRSMALNGNQLYLFGQVAGNNQAPPLIATPPNVVNLTLLPGLTDTFNLEGPSRSFVLKTNSTFSNSQIKWLGVHTPYEQALLNINHTSTASNLISFGFGNDNVWNPWVIDTTMQVVRGQMRANADRAETTQAVEYLSDGSLFIAGNSHGKTSLDTSYQSIGMGPSRRDLFMLRRAPNGTVLWYKRLYSSFTGTTINRVMVQNDKIYVLLNLFQPINTPAANYIRLDTSTLITTQLTQADVRLLLVIERSGASRMILLDDNLPSGKVNSIDIYPNGDIAAVSQMATRSLQLGSLAFPDNMGFYLMRLDSTGVIKSALKVYRLSNPPAGALPLQMSFIRISPSDNTLIVSGLYSMLSGQLTHPYVVHNGTAVIDTIFTPNYYPTSADQVRYSVLIKTNLQSISWKAMLSPGIGLGGPQSFEQVGTNSFFLYTKTQNGPILLNGQTIVSDTTQSAGMMSLNASGQFRQAKNWKDGTTIQPFIANRLKSIRGQLYVSGTLNKPLVFDTIPIAVAGYSDALTIRYDTNVIAKQSFRLATPYYETMYDIAIFQDTVYSFAYTAQQTPTFFNNRIYANPLDLEQNAFLGSFVIPRPIIPTIPANKRFLLYPNPNNGEGFSLLSRTGTNMNYSWRVFDLSGRLMTQGTKVLSAGMSVNMPLGKVLSNGYYLLALYRPDGRLEEVIQFLVRR